MSGVRNVTTVVPAGPKNSVGRERGLSSAYVFWDWPAPLETALDFDAGDFGGMLDDDDLKGRVRTDVSSWLGRFNGERVICGLYRVHSSAAPIYSRTNVEWTERWRETNQS